MKPPRQSSKKYYQFKRRPITVIVFTLFAQHAQAELLTLAQAEAQNKQQKQCIEKASGSRAKAMCKQNAQLQTQHAVDDAYDQAIAQKETATKQHLALAQIGDVDAALFGAEQENTSDAYGNAPFNVSPEIIRTAEATDAGTSNAPNKANQPNKNINSKTMGAKEGKDLPIDIKTQEVKVRAKRFHEIGPLPGLGLTKEEIPGNVQSISAKEIRESHSLSLTDLMNKKLQSVNVNDYQGNPFQMDVTYRGFTAGPQIGTPQGLSVFLDGIRVNEPFGDVVNWDMIPMNAIAGVDVFPGSNPIFGLNTLGGAFTLKTKDGFNNDGVDAEVLTGSFGRKQLQVEGGINNGEFALFGAGNFFLEDGWRDNSPSKVNQFFGKASYRGEKLDLNLSTLLVGNNLVGNGLSPSEEYARDRTSVFTGPDETKNRLAQFQLSGAFQVDDNFSITGQAYRRNSKRHAKTGDFANFFDDDGELTAKRLPAPGEEFTCVFGSTNGRGVPDYYVIPVAADVNGYADLFSNPLGLDILDNVINPADFTAYKNTDLQPEYFAAFKYQYDQWKNPQESLFYNRGINAPQPALSGTVTPAFNNEQSYNAGFSTLVGGNPWAGSGGNVIFDFGENFFFTQDNLGNITKNFVFLAATLNEDVCRPTHEASLGGQIGVYGYLDPVTGNPVLIDGALYGQPGVVEGTPTAVIGDNQIDQIVDGFSLQLNWNLDHHKFMVGASLDSAHADYSNETRLGFFDAKRNAYLDPAQAHPQFGAAFVPLSNNNFEGTSVTKSIYFSETWTPVETWHFNASGRYNQTRVKNKIAARHGNGTFDLEEFINYPDFYNLCNDANGDGTVDISECDGVPRNFRLPDIYNTLDTAEAEEFTYHSFNPSLGFTWQAKENLNVFANWAKGTRVPSVIELGCALDKTPVYTGGAGGDPSDPTQYQLKSLFENRSCTLPTTLSGDPFLEQIKATSYDVGIRGNLQGILGVDNLEWNLGAYQTDLKNDIYFVPAPGSAGAGFFDTVGKTRRRGLEAGLSGKKDKWGFSVNYGLTDATFQDKFYMFSPDNSSAKYVDLYGNGTIQVKPGDRMPGVPLHNLNATVSYEITPQWQIGLTTVVHSKSYLRGNENNKHEKGVIQRTIDYVDPLTGNNIRTQTPPTNNPGMLPGYATFNFQTSYKFNKEWAATMLVNNVFDKEYFSAGRLGRNPFSPSISGAIGPDGYNHNSNDWLSTNFIAPSAPRGIWFSLNWQFAPDKK